MNDKNKENLKQIIITIAIGAAINVLTVLFQYAIEWLRQIPPELPGTVVGIAKYLSWVGKHRA